MWSVSARYFDELAHALISVTFPPFSLPDELCSAPFQTSLCAAGAERRASLTRRARRCLTTSCSRAHCPHANTPSLTTTCRARRVSLNRVDKTYSAVLSISCQVSFCGDTRSLIVKTILLWLLCTRYLLLTYETRTYWKVVELEEVISLTAAVLPSVPLSASELSLTEVRDKVPPLRRLDPGLMPLPDTACGLEWSSLVNAAKVYEGEAADTSRLGLFNSQKHPFTSHTNCNMHNKTLHMQRNHGNKLLKHMVSEMSKRIIKTCMYNSCMVLLLI